MLITWCVAIDSFIKLYACISKIYNVIFPFFWKYLCKKCMACLFIANKGRGYSLNTVVSL